MTNPNKTQQALHTDTTRDMNSGRGSTSDSKPSSSPSALPGGESGYEPWYPSNVPADASVKRFVTRFFEVSDDPGRNEEWVSMFADDATVTIGSDVAKGKDGEFPGYFTPISKQARRGFTVGLMNTFLELLLGVSEIRQLRNRMWKTVEARKHRVVKVFPGWFSADRTAVAPLHEVEFMLFGAVAYRMRDGEEAVASWAGHAQLRRDGLSAPWKFVFYRVYIQR
ncbi:uncharacterized protein THITE_2119752 [Thermothielavioides terrestris NRRL 8126]|uniref:SnoaL-like domain-containing protein n=1 Tax=Thermothielavioides terrestris (strain ATCC 38088 / NRRL 8126) TaxID=578455 RepID=G2RC74_THETT|nr:uncharacterized protein THITE_2119752 [Thermothielavioides terrestris NRRL 8126]AEO69395.1 hypothetical protein THITE_2119752 [Thermothielavioides terrestris NRRL 8126]